MNERAKLVTPLCLSNSGCRAVIRQADGNQNFEILENFVLSLKTPHNRSVWVDYVYVVPSDEYTPALLEESPIGYFYLSLFLLLNCLRVFK